MTKCHIGDNTWFGLTAISDSCIE